MTIVLSYQLEDEDYLENRLEGCGDIIDAEDTTEVRSEKERGDGDDTTRYPDTSMGVYGRFQVC